MKKIALLASALLTGCSQFGDLSNFGSGSNSSSSYYPSSYDSSSSYENDRLRRENDRLREERDRAEAEARRRNNPSQDLIDSANHSADNHHLQVEDSVKNKAERGNQQWLNQGLGSWHN